jgi:DNA-binding transcriptional regulator YhcF (GntR family)
VILEVSVDSPVPPYEQIRAQLAAMATSGALPVGHRLPSIRQLASDLGLAPGTVARAYRELESAGVVISRAGRGTTIAPTVNQLSEQSRQRHLLDAAHAYAATARRLGASRDQALTAVSEQLNKLSPPSQATAS